MPEGIGAAGQPGTGHFRSLSMPRAGAVLQPSKPKTSTAVRSLAALEADISLISSTQVMAPKHPGDLIPSGLQGHLGTSDAHKLMQAHIDKLISLD